MWRRALTRAAGALHQKSSRTLASQASKPSSVLSRSSRSSPLTASSAINTILLQSLKEHYLEVSKMNPPPKISPPSPFTVVKGSLDREGPVLKRMYNEEEIKISVMRLANIIPDGGGDDDSDDAINQLFVHVDISKSGEESSLHFLCGLYPDALGIHSVSMRPKLESRGFLVAPTAYYGPAFQDLDEKVRDALHGYIEERGIDESLFAFLQAWLYVKDHRRLLGWFKSIGEFVKDGKNAASPASRVSSSM